MDKKCTKSSDGIHGLVGGVRGDKVRCGFCGQLDEKLTKRSQEWWKSQLIKIGGK